MENNKIIPFVINSNICTSESDISSYDVMMNAIAGNTGNSYITWSLLKEIGCKLEAIRGHEIKSLYTYDFSRADRDIDIINNECTNVILVLQDQIRISESYGLRLPFKQLQKFISRIKKPILVAGLGANSLNGFDSDFHKKLDDELIVFLHFLSDHCASIGIRGYFTQEVLHNLGIDNTCVIGCPSYYETGRDRVVNTPNWKKELKYGTSAMEIPLISNSAAIYLQDRTPSEEMIIKSIAFNANNKFPSKICHRIEKEKYRFFTSINSWKDDVKNLDLYFGVRVHGSILAINSGVPVVVMSGDSRAKEMCEFMNIPHHPELGYCKSLKRVIEKCSCEKMNREYNNLLDDFVSFLNKNGLCYNPLAEQNRGVDLGLYKGVAIERYGLGDYLKNIFK